jgi:hypothetical protein
MIGGLVVGGIAGVTAVHGVGMGVRFKRRRMIAARETTAAATDAPTAEPALAVVAPVAVAERPADAVPPAPMSDFPPDPTPAAPVEELELAEIEAAAEAAQDVETPVQLEER